MIKVLVVDDESIMIRLVQQMLQDPEFEVYTADSGSEGVELVREKEPDIVLLDLMMPGMSGWEACRTIRSFSQVPILVLSAVTGAEGVMRSLEEGANGYLVKPVPKGVLISHIKNLIQ